MWNFEYQASQQKKQSPRRRLFFFGGGFETFGADFEALSGDFFALEIDGHGSFGGDVGVGAALGGAGSAAADLASS